MAALARDASPPVASPVRRLVLIERTTDGRAPAPPVSVPVERITCPGCRHLLFEVALSPGSGFRVRCPKCNQWTTRELVEQT